MAAAPDAADVPARPARPAVLPRRVPALLAKAEAAAEAATEPGPGLRMMGASPDGTKKEDAVCAVGALALRTGNEFPLLLLPPLPLPLPLLPVLRADAGCLFAGPDIADAEPSNRREAD